MISAQFVAEWTLRSSLLIGSGAFLLWAFRVKDPSVRLAAWTAVLAASLVLPVLSAVLPVIHVPSIRPVIATLVSPPVPSSPVAVEAPRVLSGEAHSLSILSGVTEAVERTHESTVEGISTAGRNVWTVVGLTTYLLGAVLLLVRMLAGLQSSRRLLRISSPTGLTTDGITVLESTGVSTPVTLGMVRPFIVLPADWREWDVTTLGAVLAHERAHARRRDPAVQVLSLLHRTLLWHNPLSWVLHQRLVRTAEDASDDAAVTVTGDRVLYAEILLGFMQRGIVRPVPLAVPMARYGGAAERIDRILDGTRVSMGLRRWTAAAIVAVTMLAAGLVAAAQARPAFEIADVHVTPQRADGRSNLQVEGGAIRGARYEIYNATMIDLVRTAYGVEAAAVIGGPSWLAVDRFDIIAKPPEKTTSAAANLMLQSLLADRFDLVARRDTRPMPAWVLSRGTDEPRLRRPNSSEASGCRNEYDNSRDTPNDHLSCRNVPIDAFIDWLRAAPRTILPVINATGIEGVWDFDLDGLDLARARGVSDNSPILDTVKRQLGLVLELRLVPQPVIVVERVNRTPTPNAPDVAKRLPPDPTEFEVASIRPCQFVNPLDTGGETGLRASPSGQVTSGCQSLATHIATAWSLGNDLRAFGNVILRPTGPSSLEGAPQWLASKYFNIVAKAPVPVGVGAPLVRDVKYQVMLRNLLVQRFKMVTHYEDRVLDVFALVAVKPTLKTADPSSRTGCRSTGIGIGAPTVVTCQNVTMAQFAEELNHDFSLASGLLRGRRIVDETGLQGPWDVTFNYRIGPAPAEVPGVASEPTGYMSAREALERQLGLNLVEAKRPMPIFVIDHIEENPTD